MTVKELIVLLSEEQEDAIVVMATDSEGNSFSPVSLGFTPCEYEDQEIRTQDSYDDECWDGDFEPDALVLWPSH